MWWREGGASTTRQHTPALFNKWLPMCHCVTASLYFGFFFFRNQMLQIQGLMISRITESFNCHLLLKQRCIEVGLFDFGKNKFCMQRACGVMTSRVESEVTRPLCGGSACLCMQNLLFLPPFRNHPPTQ